MTRIFHSIADYFKKSDKALWLLTIIAIVYSLMLIASMQRSGEYNFLQTQIIAIATGLVSAIIISAADYKYIIKKWYFAAIISFILAGLVFVFGIQVAGTDDTAWIQIGSLTIQPSEFIKICFIITFTKHLTYLEEKDMLKSFVGVITLVLHAMIPMIIIHMQGDDGTVLIFALIFLFMSFIAGVQLRYFAILGGILLVSVPLIWNLFMNDDQRNRLLALFDIDGNAMTTYGWQQYQGKVSISSGSLFGKGLFNGPRVEHGIVPEQENDFMIILLLIMIRILINAKQTNDMSGKLLCSGAFAIISSQTIINIGMVLGFFPVIGITLPLFSAGGTSALATLICLGLVQSVRTHNLGDMNTAVVRREIRNRFKI